jgi:hypothetical protein
VGTATPEGHPPGVIDLTETATFRADDEPCLVEASLSCRVCLSGHIEWSLRSREWDAEVVCRCEECGDVRTVSLTGDQALRLSLDRRLAHHN